MKLLALSLLLSGCAWIRTHMGPCPECTVLTPTLASAYCAPDPLCEEIEREIEAYEFMDVCLNFKPCLEALEKMP